MISIISGTNRIESKTLRVAEICKEIVDGFDKACSIVDLKLLSNTSLRSDMYITDNQDVTVAEIQDKVLLPSDKWIIIIPEYNGGVPGIFKLFLDILSMRLKDKTFHNKTALLIGVAAGRAGNARGLDYLTNCLHYLGMDVFSSKLPISSINQVMENGNLNQGTMDVLSDLIHKFMKA